LAQERKPSPTNHGTLDAARRERASPRLYAKNLSNAIHYRFRLRRRQVNQINHIQTNATIEASIVHWQGR
jgi:hypothetical protein